MTSIRFAVKSCKMATDELRETRWSRSVFFKIGCCALQIKVSKDASASPFGDKGEMAEYSHMVETLWTIKTNFHKFR